MLNPFRWSFRTQYFRRVSCLCGVAAPMRTTSSSIWASNPARCASSSAIAFIAHGHFLPDRRIARSARTRTACVRLAGPARRLCRHRHRGTPSVGAAPAAGSDGRLHAGLELHGRRISRSARRCKMAFTGSADCSEVNWTFLGLSMPFWTLVCFVAAWRWRHLGRVSQAQRRFDCRSALAPLPRCGIMAFRNATNGVAMKADPRNLSAVRETPDWAPDSWQRKPAVQQPDVPGSSCAPTTH